MPARIAVAALAAMAAAWLPMPSTAQAEVVRYRLDPDRSFVHFEVLHFGTSTSRGRFGPIQGEVLLDVAGRRGEVGLQIDVNSVSTGFRIFDSRLKEPDLLATAEYPTAWFVARSFSFTPEGTLSEVRGEFTMRGVSQGLSLKAIRFGCRQDAERQREVCGGDFEGRIDRSSIGASFGVPLVSDSVRLVVQVEGVREP